jgi:tetratricopeptide (TPR) repeat protein
MSGEYREDIKHLLKRYEQAPESRLFAPLADAYRKAGEIDRAIELCEKGLEKHPSYASAHVILGKCFYDKGATERARSEFLRVIELDPENMVALKSLGDIFLAEGDSDGAARFYKQLITIDPSNENVAAALKELEENFQVRQIDLSDDRKVTKVDSPRELATMTLAGIYAAQGYYNKALKIYQDIVRNEPDNREAVEMVGKLEALMNASEEERKGAFDDEVLTISLDDVSDEMAASTAGAGGIDTGQGGGDSRAAARTDGEAPGGEGETPSEKTEHLPGVARDNELAEAMRELDEAEDETVEEDAGEVTSDEEEGEVMGKEPPRGMKHFQEWIRKIQSDKDDK